MMTQCPLCGSNEIIPDLILLGNSYPAVRNAAVVLANPKNHAECVAVALRVAICGACGHAELYTARNKELLEAYKKAWIPLKES